jgi:hypothetical protein
MARPGDLRPDRRLEANLSALVGKAEVVRLAIVGLLARGHLLIEDVPGVGKTTLAAALARSLGAGFQRIQFTSDMLPSDVLGVAVYEPDKHEFVFKPGPIFTNIVLADEINRTTPKTQSSLLEAMNEAQVSLTTTHSPGCCSWCCHQNQEHGGRFRCWSPVAPLPPPDPDQLSDETDERDPPRRGTPVVETLETVLDVERDRCRTRWSSGPTTCRGLPAGDRDRDADRAGSRSGWARAGPRAPARAAHALADGRSTAPDDVGTSRCLPRAPGALAGSAADGTARAPRRYRAIAGRPVPR